MDNDVNDEGEWKTCSSSSRTLLFAASIIFFENHREKFSAVVPPRSEKAIPYFFVIYFWSNSISLV